MFKVNRRMTPSYIISLFSESNNRTNRYVLPKPRIDLYKTSLSFSGSTCWNSLPVAIKTVGTIKSFKRVCLLFVGCLTSQQHASVSQGRICTDNFTCCHTEIEAADQTFHLTQSQYTDTGPTSPSADPITPGAWQGSHWSANF